VQEEQLKSGMRPGDEGYGKEPSERYGKRLMIDIAQYTVQDAVNF
jgi:hypothetical protein